MKVVHAMVQSWHAHGVLVFVYINNFAVVASSLEELCWICDQVVELSLAWLGWVCETTKGQWEPTQVVEVMGLLLDLRQGCVFVPELKLLWVETICWVCAGDCMTWWSLAAIVGFVMALKCAAPLVQVYLRAAYALVGGQRYQWDRIVVISLEVVEDLQWIVANL
jgi:hypothetical protein